MEFIRGVLSAPVKTVIYGPEGIGKSTLASQWPEPVFIDVEGSTKNLDVPRFPDASTWQSILADVDHVIHHPDCCRTLVIDTMDKAEVRCTEHVLKANSKTGIEEFGYGKGYVYLQEEFQKLLDRLDEVIECGIHVVCVAHAYMRKFEQPDEMGAYDRWELKLSRKCAPITKEWADMILFCNYKTLVVNVDDQGALKGKNKARGGKRVMYSTHHPCWDAKNRFGLPDEMELGYGPLAGIISTDIQKPEKPAAKLLRMMQESGIEEWDIQNLATGQNWGVGSTTPVDEYSDALASFLVSNWGIVKEKVTEQRQRDAEEVPFN